MATDTTRRIAAITFLAEAFRQKTTSVMFDAYLMGLEDISTEAVELAAKCAMRFCKFMPTVAELREFSGESTADDRAVLAWGIVVESVQGIGPYKHVDFDDPIINATIRNLGGWPTFIERFSSAESEKWARNDFCKTYSTMQRSGVNGECCLPLAGISEGRIGNNGEIIPCVPIVIRTGLPATHRRINKSNIPRVEFKKP